MHGIFDRLRDPRDQLAPANVAPAWAAEGSWRHWGPPANFISGESHYSEALTALAGPPREAGYLIPVTVSLLRDPANRHDRNAFRALIDAHQVGHLARPIAVQLAAPLDSVGCAEFQVCGLLRGGSLTAPNIGVHVWLDRRLSSGPEIRQRDQAGQVGAWPPREDEGFEVVD